MLGHMDVFGARRIRRAIRMLGHMDVLGGADRRLSAPRVGQKIRERKQDQQTER